MDSVMAYWIKIMKTCEDITWENQLSCNCMNND